MMSVHRAVRQGAWLISLATVVFSIVRLNPVAAQAQTWPTRNMTVIVPFTAGSASDVIARIAFDQVSKQVGWPIVIENRGGAGGTLGANVVAKAVPDGHTILTTGSLGAAYGLYPTLPYATLADFAPVISLGRQPHVLLTAPSTGFKTFGDLIAAAKARPGALNFGSAGIGSTSHFAAERLSLSAGMKAQHIPFRGPAEAITETIAGRVDFMFLPVTPALSLIRDGTLVALAVSGSKRAPALAEVPTTAEVGLIGAEYDYWAGLFLPAKTPREIVVRLHREMETALQMPSVQERLAKLGLEPMPMSLEQFDKYFRDDVAATVRLVKAANIVVRQ